MTRDEIIKGFVDSTIDHLLQCEQHIDVVNTLTSQFDRALDVGTNYLKFKHPKSCTIEQLDKYGNVIQPFDSIRQASRLTNIPRSSIRRTLKGEQHSTFNKELDCKTHWRYKK
jgi:hypothetical protein